PLVRAGVASTLLGATAARGGVAAGATAVGGGGEAAEGGALAGFAALAWAGAPFPAEDAAAFTSSPSAAMTAISWFTGTSAAPSGTTILASVPSSTASYSMVALSVSISAITSPGLTLSPSFLSHLARLPFSIVGDSAGIRMLIGMAGVSRSADCGGGAGVGRAVELGIEHHAYALERARLRRLAFALIDPAHVPGDVGQQHAPRLRIVERRPQRHMQRAVHDDRAKDFDAATLQRRRRNVQRVERGPRASLAHVHR